MPKDEYRAYMLRMWRAQEDGLSWRIRLEEVQTGKQHAFASLDKLIEFFQDLERERHEKDVQERR